MNITFSNLEVLLAHDPEPLFLTFSENAQQGDMLKMIVTPLGAPKSFFLKYHINKESNFKRIDIKAITSSLFQDSFREETYKVLQIEVLLYRANVTQSIAYVEKKLGVINASTSLYLPDTDRRLGNSRIGEKNLTHFKGYPQIDAFFVNTHHENNPEYGAVVFQNRTWKKSVLSDNDYDFIPNAYVFREVDECGIFLRWRNPHGGWSYGLFSDIYTQEIKTKSLGKNENEDLTINRHLRFRLRHFGYDTKKTWTLQSKVPIFEKELDEIQSLLYSPEVYLFTGNKSDRYDNEDYSKGNPFSLGDWQRVSIADGSHKVKRNDHATYDMSVTIEFENVPTIKYI